MTHQVYRILFLLILLAVGYDVLVNGSENIIFLFRKFIELLDWLIFWR